MKDFLTVSLAFILSSGTIFGIFYMNDSSTPKYKLSQSIRFKQKDFYIGVCSDRGTITDYYNSGLGGGIVYSVKTNVCDSSCDCPTEYEVFEKDILGVFND